MEQVRDYDAQVRAFATWLRERVVRGADAAPADWGMLARSGWALGVAQAAETFQGIFGVDLNGDANDL